MNLEVVRSRAARGGAGAPSIGHFAEAAAGELERASALVDAFLTLARPLAAPVDLWNALRPLVTLYDALAGADDGHAASSGAPAAEHEVEGEGVGPGSRERYVVLEPSHEASNPVDADPVAVRLALVTGLEAAVSARRPARVRCEVKPRGSDAMVVELHCEEPKLSITGAMSGLIEAEGIRLDSSPEGITVSFSARGRIQSTSM